MVLFITIHFLSTALFFISTIFIKNSISLAPNKKKDALKYFVIGLFSSAFFLFGSTIIYGFLEIFNEFFKILSFIFPQTHTTFSEPSVNNFLFNKQAFFPYEYKNPLDSYTNEDITKFYVTLYKAISASYVFEKNIDYDKVVNQCICMHLQSMSLVKDYDGPYPYPRSVSPIFSKLFTRYQDRYVLYKWPFHPINEANRFSLAFNSELILTPYNILKKTSEFPSVLIDYYNHHYGQENTLLLEELTVIDNADIMLSNKAATFTTNIIDFLFWNQRETVTSYLNLFAALIIFYEDWFVKNENTGIQFNFSVQLNPFKPDFLKYPFLIVRDPSYKTEPVSFWFILFEDSYRTVNLNVYKYCDQFDLNTVGLFLEHTEYSVPPIFYYYDFLIDLDWLEQNFSPMTSREMEICMEICLCFRLMSLNLN